MLVVPLLSCSEGYRPPFILTETIPTIQVPLLGQSGDVLNCGPTAASMMLGYYESRTAEDLTFYQYAIGYWTWDEYPVRRLYFEWGGMTYGPGGSLPEIMVAGLNRYAQDTYRVKVFDSYRPLYQLQGFLTRRRPVMVLLNSGTLWQGDPVIMGLHWVVVVGMTPDKVKFVDPSGGQLDEVTHDRFRRAWGLGVIQSLIFSPFSGIVGP